MLVNLLLAIGILALDQFTKYLIITYVKPVMTVPIIQGAVHLTYVENKGAAFSILQNQRWFFIIATALLLIGIVIVWGKRKDFHPLCRTALVMIFGGAMGNLFDRIFRGFVVDMFDFRIINYAIFNVADCFLVTGTILLCMYILIFEKGSNRGGGEKSG